MSVYHSEERSLTGGQNLEKLDTASGGDRKTQINRGDCASG